MVTVTGWVPEIDTKYHGHVDRRRADPQVEMKANKTGKRYPRGLTTDEMYLQDDTKIAPSHLFSFVTLLGGNC